MLRGRVLEFQIMIKNSREQFNGHQRVPAGPNTFECILPITQNNTPMLNRISISSLLTLLFFAVSIQAQSLCQAVSNNDLALAATLINAGADPNQADTTGQTPLLIATMNGDVPMATLLLDNGADVNLPGPNAQTPLMHAAALSFIDLIDLYIDRQADPLLLDDQQMSAFDHAAESNAVSGTIGSITVDPDAVYARLYLAMNP